MSQRKVNIKEKGKWKQKDLKIRYSRTPYNKEHELVLCVKDNYPNLKPNRVP